MAHRDVRLGQVRRSNHGGARRVGRAIERIGGRVAVEERQAREHAGERRGDFRIAGRERVGALDLLVRDEGVGAVALDVVARAQHEHVGLELGVGRR